MAQGPTYLEITYVRPGSRLDQSRASAEVAFDRLAPNGLYDLFVGLVPDNERCLTCADPQFPGHNGNPAWHPSGAFLVFQAHDVSLTFLPVEREHIEWLMTSPGWGTNNNLWLMSRDGSASWLLRQVAAGEGTLHPHFTHDGTRLVWAEKVGVSGATEFWTIKLADLDWEAGQPVLRNITDIEPFGTQFFYETHGFTSDDAKIIFSGGQPELSSLDIYTYDLGTGQALNLTGTPAEWDEHAHMSPDGSQIVWASSRDVTKPRDYFVPFLDYWTMDADGSNQRRLTYFNEVGAPEHYPNGVVAADFAFGADGTSLVSRLELTVPGAGLPRDTFEAIVLIGLE